MRQDEFIARRAADWEAMERWLARPRGRKREPDASDLAFPAQYRRVCQDFAIAQRRAYGPALLDRLEALVQAGHDTLYQPPPPRWRRIAGFLGAGLPRLVRAHWRFVALSALLLFGPMLAMGWLVHEQPALMYSVHDADAVSKVEQMYDPAGGNHVGARPGSTNLQMFGFYIMNNISIGFRTFASGLLFGLGAIVTLVLNGVMIGSVAGHLQQVGYGVTFWKFVAGHSGPELMAIVLSGAGGMRLGWSLVAPGRLSRGHALREAALDGVQLALGAFVLLLIAAFVEAYWSSIGSRPHWLAYASGALGWAAVLGWLLLGGRRAP